MITLQSWLDYIAITLHPTKRYIRVHWWLVRSESNEYE